MIPLAAVVPFKTLTFHNERVATHLRCGGIFCDSIITKCSPILTAKKKFENRSIFDEVKAYEKCAIFWATLYSLSTEKKLTHHRHVTLFC